MRYFTTFVRPSLTRGSTIGVKISHVFIYLVCNYKKIKKTLAIVKIVCYSNKRFVGQAVKTPPSHGGNTGSIPVRTVQGFLEREIFFLFKRKTLKYINSHGIFYDFCATELDEGKHNRSKNISWEFIFKCLRYKN